MAANQNSVYYRASIGKRKPGIIGKRKRLLVAEAFFSPGIQSSGEVPGGRGSAQSRLNAITGNQANDPGENDHHGDNAEDDLLRA